MPDDAAARALLATLAPDGAADPALRAACTEVARRLHAGRHRIVGFVPADDQVAVPAALLHLGRALCDLTGATIAVVDANARYPGLGALAESAGDRRGRLATRWLGPSLALLSPTRPAAAGEVVPELARALAAGAELYAHVLCDLTGFAVLGEHASAAACMDAVAVVVRSHATDIDALRQIAQLMPADRFLGVLLVG